MNLHKAFGIAVGDRTIHFLERLNVSVERDAALLRFVFVKADVRNFRLGVSAPRHRERAQFFSAEKERVLDDDARRKIRRVCELPIHANIARGEDAWIGRAQVFVHAHAVLAIEFHPDALEVQAVDIRSAPRARENFIYDQISLLSSAGEIDVLAIFLSRHARELCVEDESNSFENKLLLHDARGIHVFAVEQMRFVVKDCDLRTEALKGLREFTANRPATNHSEPLRQARKIEHRFVCQETDIAQAGNVRFDGTCAGRNDRVFETQPRSADLNRRRVNELSFAEKYIDAQSAEALRGIMWADVRAHGTDTFHHRRKIHFDLWRAHPKAIYGSSFLCSTRGAD